MLKIFVFIQARSTSTRLPGKVLKEMPASKQLLLDHIVERIDAVFPREQIMLLIPQGDAALSQYCATGQLNYFAGDEMDVHSRFVVAGKQVGAEYIIRLTADNPFIDVEYLYLLAEACVSGGADIFSFQGLPLGCGAEAFRYDALVKEPQGGFLPRHKEHVSLHMKEDVTRYTFRKLQTTNKFSCSEHIRVTVDVQQDFDFVNLLYKELSPHNPLFGVVEMEALYLKRPEFFQYNQNVTQIRFPISISPQNKQKKIFILFASVASQGSGHYERMKVAYVKLQALGYQVAIGSELPEDVQNYKTLVVDARDFAIPKKWQNKRIVLIDNMGEDRTSYSHLDTLPNLSSPNWNLLPDILLPFFSHHKWSNSPEKMILVYSGNLSDKEVYPLDKAFYESYANEYQIIRIGRAASEFVQVQTYPRLSKKQLWDLLLRTSVFVTYFGQSLWEAIYLGKPVVVYSISDYHEKLNQMMQKHLTIQSLGSSDRISSQQLPLPKSILPVKAVTFGNGYQKLIDLINY